MSPRPKSPTHAQRRRSISAASVARRQQRYDAAMAYDARRDRQVLTIEDDVALVESDPLARWTWRAPDDRS